MTDGRTDRQTRCHSKHHVMLSVARVNVYCSKLLLQQAYRQPTTSHRTTYSEKCGLCAFTRCASCYVLSCNIVKTCFTDTCSLKATWLDWTRCVWWRSAAVRNIIFHFVCFAIAVHYSASVIIYCIGYLRSVWRQPINIQTILMLRPPSCWTARKFFQLRLNPNEDS